MLAVTVLAVLIAAIAAALTRNSWADKTNQKSDGLSVRLQQTTTTFGSPSTTLGNVSTTVALPVPSTSSTARSATTLTTKPATVPTIGSTATTGATPTTRGGSTTSTTKVPPGSYDQRSDNDATFTYPPPGTSSQGPTSSKGALAYIVKGEADASTNTWHLTTDVRNNSGREVRFEGGIDTVVHLLCNGKSGDQHLANPGVTTMPAGGGVILQADVTPIDKPDNPPPPGTLSCTLFGTIHYSTV